MKLFELMLREHIGEKEFTYNNLISARTLKSAEKQAHKYARRFWSSYENSKPVRKKNGQYEFNNGEIIVSVEDVSETTKEQFLEECYQRAMIGKV